MGGVQPNCGKIGCTGGRLGPAGRAGPKPARRLQTEESVEIEALECEDRALRQANEVLRKASAYFAQTEFDRPFKR